MFIITDLHDMTTYVAMSAVSPYTMDIFKNCVLIWEVILPIVDNFTLFKSPNLPQ